MKMFPMLCRSILLLSLYFAVSANDESSSPFSFVVLSDIHSFTELSFKPFDDTLSVWKQGKKILKNIKDNYGGGKFVVMPGDGASYGDTPTANFVTRLGGNLSDNEAVYKGGVNCHSSTKELFRSAGFDVLLPAVGDHELGGNEGFQKGSRGTKLSTVPDYRQAYADGFFRDVGQQSGEYLFSTPVADAPARPVGTMFEGSSFAYRFRNVVVISVDAFRLVNNGAANYFDREQGLCGEGAITCDVSGAHLTWFENVLKAARQDSTVKHIFVEAHLPIIQPVRKVNCSEQFFDRADKSEFWKLMIQYQVDIYFAGEVHSNTVSKEPNSNLIQIVSASNGFSGFMTVDITDNQIHVKHFNEEGDEPRFNNKYIQDGSLYINKSEGDISIESSGELELLDDSVALIHFDFEEITPLGTRQVLSFRGDKTPALMGKSIDIDDVTCTDSLENQGSFSKQYDAQIGNIELVQGRPGGGRSAQFTHNSRLAIYGVGPMSGGQIVSISLWFKTSHAEKDMVLVYYGQPWGPSWMKDQLVITLRNGIPTFHISRDQAYTVTGISPIADNNWHHLALTMPKQSCLSSEIQLYIDGDRASLETMMPSSPDKHVFFATYGRMSFGGFGYSSNEATRNIYKDMVPYMGNLDEVTVWSRTLSIKDIIILASTNTTSPESVSSPSPSPTKSPVFICDENNCTDDETYEFPLKNGKVQNCAWFGKNNTARRRAKYCVEEEIKSACRKSCSAIGPCEDDPAFTFSLLNKKTTRYCSWMKRGKNITKRRNRYCFESDGRLTPTVLAASCSQSCGVCAEV